MYQTSQQCFQYLIAFFISSWQWLDLIFYDISSLYKYFKMDKLNELRCSACTVGRISINPSSSISVLMNWLFFQKSMKYAVTSLIFSTVIYCYLFIYLFFFWSCPIHNISWSLIYTETLEVFSHSYSFCNYSELCAC